MEMVNAVEAFQNEVPVSYNGITFKKISAIIFRKHKGKITQQLELLDKTGHCAVIADASRVQNILQKDDYEL